MTDFDLTPEPEAEAPKVQWGVEPRDLDEFKKAQETLRKARAVADILPAEITDRSQAAEASEALKQLRFAREDVTTASKAVKAPYDAYGKRVLAAFREVGSSNDAAEESVKARLLVFNRAEQKKADEERKKAEKSERERQARENARAEKENRASKAVAPSARPAPVPKSVGTGFAKSTVRKVRKYEVTNEAEIPDEFFDKVLSKSKLNAAVKAGLVVAGVRQWEEDQVATR